jgi:protein ImuB
VQPELKGCPIVLSAPAFSSGRSTGDHVRHCSRAAVAAGVRPGMPLAEAQALLGAGTASHIAPHDPQADRKLLQLLAGWCARYSPLVGLEQSDEPSTLFFDLTGCSHLFGGEEEMATQVARDFEHVGYFVRVAIADTIGAAWATVRHRSRHAPRADGWHDLSFYEGRGLRDMKEPSRNDECLSSATPFAKAQGVPPGAGMQSMPATIIPPGRQSALLRDLPVAALRLSADVVETLHELGIGQIGQLQGLPRSTLPARFGPSVLERLDQALGLTQELIVPVPPCEPIAADWSFEDPTADRRALEAVLHRLIGEITETLASRQEGAQRLECRLFCAGKEPVHLEIGTLQPTAVAAHLCELIHLQLERATLAGEVLAVHVEVAASGPLGTKQEELFDAGIHRNGQRHLAVLLDRLSSRLGEKAVLRPYMHPDPQPEYTSLLVTALAGGGILNCKLKIEKCKLEEAESIHSKNLKFSIFNFQFSIPPSGQVESMPDYRLINAPAARPLCLKPRPIPVEVISVVPDGPPVRFRWQGGEHVIENCWGPERIETGWWRGPHVKRDYYRVETAVGQRFWLFRHNDTGKWFLHGTFE